MKQVKIIRSRRTCELPVFKEGERIILSTYVPELKNNGKLYLPYVEYVVEYDIETDLEKENEKLKEEIKKLKEEIKIKNEEIERLIGINNSYSALKRSLYEGEIKFVR